MDYLEVLVFVGCLHLMSGCRKPSYYSWPEDTDTEENVTTTTEGGPPDDANRIAAGSFGGFEVPEETLKILQEWLDEIKKQQETENSHNDSSKFEHERGPGSGWPFSWGGLGAGHEGFPPGMPPMHAFQPTNHLGVPDHCFLVPRKGRCNYTLERWYYHPYLDQCLSFNYSGCDGNRNKYETQLLCEKECMTEPGSGCDSETNIEDTYDIIENRRRKAGEALRRRC